MLTDQFPTVAQLLLDAKADLTAFSDFPRAHWQKIWSTNPLERLNREVKRRTDVVGIFPNPAALLRLSACVLIEAHDEWQDSDRRYLSEESMALLNPPDRPSSSPRRPPPPRPPGGRSPLRHSCSHSHSNTRRATPLAPLQKIWSPPPQRLNREVKRRTDVVGIFPNPAALLRLSACVLIEAHDEWQDSDRRYLSEESMALLNPPEPTILEPKKTTPAKTPRRQITATA